MSSSPALNALIGRLKTWAVDWKFPFVPAENGEYEVGTDREEADLDKANIVSSLIKSAYVAGATGRHKVLLDIDYPAYVVPSSSPGHHHVYLDVPVGVAHDDYMELLALLGRIGVIERGYADVSIARGHSDLRLPWVSKTDQVLHDETPAPASVREDDTPSLPDLDF